MLKYLIIHLFDQKSRQDKLVKMTPGETIIETFSMEVSFPLRLIFYEPN